MRNQRDSTFDFNLRLKDAGLVAASAAAQVGGANKILDLGAGRADGRVIVDTTAVEVDTGDEEYAILIQGSNSSTFASTNVQLGAAILGHSSKTLESASTAAAGRREIAFSTEVDGTIYRYVRAYTRIAGTIATGINFTANVVLDAP